jgi:phage gpG-like protein
VLDHSTIDLRDVLAGLRGMKTAGADLRPLWQSLRKIVRDDVQDHFTKRDAPDGSWADYAQSTRDRITWRRGMVFKRGKKKGFLTARGAKRITNMLGRLRSSWLFELTPSTFTMRSRVPWASIHQTGGTVRGRTIPKREFAWVTDKVIATVADFAAAFIVRAW